LVDNDRRKEWTAVSAEFDFVEPEKGEYIKRKVDIGPDDIEMVKEQIKETYTKIMNHKFTGCGKEDCQWCTFAKTNFQRPQNILEKVGEDETEAE
jgi:DNA helicase-2/ATP-dependent DNA helicase PcrA